MNEQTYAARSKALIQRIAYRGRVMEEDLHAALLPLAPYFWDSVSKPGFVLIGFNDGSRVEIATNVLK